MDPIILLIISVLLLLFINKKTIENFTLGTCDIHEQKMKLLEERLNTQMKTLTNDEMNQRLDLIDQKIMDINQKIKEKEEKEILEEEEKEILEEEKEILEEEEVKDILEEESIYSTISRWNKEIYDNYLVNGLIAILAITLFIFFGYFFFKFVIQFAKERKFNIKKIGLSYDDVLDELKKKKLEGKLKIKKIKN
tara:strand:- start:15608 stop:16189 length:582 start_codon:yes stop_codon:yes gene_type:complete